MRGAKMRDRVIHTATFEFEVRQIVMRDDERRDAVAGTAFGRFLDQTTCDVERLLITIQCGKWLRGT